MKDFFSLGGPFFTGLEKLVNLIWLSILWFVFSIPLITIGASTTSLYYVSTKVLRNNRGYILREFLSCFKSNFKQSTLIWILYAAIMGACYGYMVIIKNTGIGIASILTILLILIMILVTLIFMYCLPYVARFKQTTGNLLLLCTYMTFRHLPWTLLLALIGAATIAGCIVTIAGIFIIPAIGSLLSGLVLEHIFAKYMTEEDRHAEMLRNRPEMVEYTDHE